MSVFLELEVWHDSEPRSAAENMAMDQILLEQRVSVPLLRFYTWSEPTVSFGYFGCYTEAVEHFNAAEDREQSDLVYVRRWTGGGMVDHRVGETYTLILPKGHEVEQMRGAGSYGVIHKALAESLRDRGEDVRLCDGAEESGEALCFMNPVFHDVLGNNGCKISGAGQKRSRFGLLHQGSVLSDHDVLGWKECFMRQLCETYREEVPEFQKAVVEHLVQTRYSSEEWLKRR